MQSGSRLLTTGEVARLCGFSPSSVLRWIRDGQLPACSSPGARHRVDPKDLLVFLQEHEMRVPPELEAEAPYRILVVDDDEAVRNVLGRALEASELDCEVETAGSTIDACIKMAVFKPHLVLLDLVMPDLDGAELCHVLKASKEFSRTKVLMITGYRDDPRREGDFAAEGDGWLHKPVSAEELVDAVRALLLDDTPVDVRQATDEAACLPLDTDLDLLGEYVVESLDHIAAAEAALVELETDPEASESIHTIFRAFHTIKGTSGFLGLDGIQKLAHLAENLPDRAREGQLRLTGGYADLALESCDTLKAMVQALEGLEPGAALEAPAGYAGLLARLAGS